MNPTIGDILTGKPIPEEIWESPESLWEETKNEQAGGDTWTPIQAILFARRLAEVPEHIKLIEQTHPHTGDSLLHWAVRWELIQEVAILLKQGANPLQPNHKKETPAMIAKNPMIQNQLKLQSEHIKKEKARMAIKGDLKDTMEI